MIKDVISWSLTAPRRYELERRYGRVETKYYGANMTVPIKGVAMKILAADRSIWFYQSLPGMIPLHYIQQGDAVHISQSVRALREFAEANGFKMKDIEQCQQGIAYHLSGKGFKKYIVDHFSQYDNTKMPLRAAADRLFTELTMAGGWLKGRKVVTPISGGTDGLLTALTLKAIGVEQVCVCVGRTEEDFDPSYARKYAEQLGLDYVFLPLPTADEDLSALLETTLRNIEQVDFSNVLMGMCNTLIAQYAKSIGVDMVVGADLADVILGNDMLSWGSFRKEYPNPTPMDWARYRKQHQLKNLPTNMMVYRSFEAEGVEVCQLFADRGVIELALSFSLEVTPPDGTKPLYYDILNRHVEGGSWVEKTKKVGYYTGSGIGKIRLENPILSDENIRKVYSNIK